MNAAPLRNPAERRALLTATSIANAMRTSKRNAVSTSTKAPDFAPAESLITDGSREYNSLRRERAVMTETSIQPIRSAHELGSAPDAGRSEVDCHSRPDLGDCRGAAPVRAGPEISVSACWRSAHPWPPTFLPLPSIHGQSACPKPRSPGCSPLTCFSWRS